MEVTYPNNNGDNTENILGKIYSEAGEVYFGHCICSFSYTILVQADVVNF